MLGFKNTRVMKGGIVGLAEGNTPKNAPLKQGQIKCTGSILTDPPRNPVSETLLQQPFF